MDAHAGGQRSVRLLRRGDRRTAIGLAVAGATVTGVVGRRVTGDEDGGRVDHAFDRLVDTLVPAERGVGRLLAEGVSGIGSPIPVALVMVALAVLAWFWRGPRALSLVLVGPPVAMITTSTILKPIIGRTRGDELAYPSGHTTAVASMAVALAVLVLSSSLAPRWRVALVAALGLLVLAVATALVARNYHWPTDTVGAFAVALAVVLPAALAVDAAADDLTDDSSGDRTDDSSGDLTDRRGGGGECGRGSGGWVAEPETRPFSGPTTWTPR